MFYIPLSLSLPAYLLNTVQGFFVHLACLLVEDFAIKRWVKIIALR